MVLFVFIIFGTCLLVAVCSGDLLKENSVEINETDSANWTSCYIGSDSAFVFVANFHLETSLAAESEYLAKFQLLDQANHIERLMGILDRLSMQNHDMYFNNTEKKSIGCVARVVAQASQSPILAEKFFRSGITPKLMQIIFRFDMLNDTNFANDLLICGLSIINDLLGVVDSLETDTKFEQWLEDFWLPIKRQFEVESSPLLKLMIIDLLFRRNRWLIDLRESDLPALKGQELLLLRDSVFSNKSGNQYEFHQSMKTKFLGLQIVTAKRGSIQKLFNTLLLSEKNRNLLCNKKTFEDFFVIITILTENIQFDVRSGSDSGSDARDIKFREIWIVASLRGLYIETVSCPSFRPFFQDSHLRSGFSCYNTA